MAPNGARRIFPSNPDLADILGRTDLSFEIFIFWICWTLDFSISSSWFSCSSYYTSKDASTRRCSARSGHQLQGPISYDRRIQSSRSHHHSIATTLSSTTVKTSPQTDLSTSRYDRFESTINLPFTIEKSQKSSTFRRRSSKSGALTVSDRKFRWTDPIETILA